MKIDISEDQQYLITSSSDRVVDVYNISIISEVPSLDLCKQLKIRDDS